MAVRDNLVRKRYELEFDDGIAYIDYRKAPGVVTLLYAKVPPALIGRGYGAQLTRETLDLIRAQGDKVIPRCSFVAIYMRRHAQYQDMLAEP